MSKQNLLLTGANGFLGQNLFDDLRRKYLVCTLGFSSSNNISVDLSQSIPQLNENFQIVLHAAGTAHFNPKTQAERDLFYNVNFTGVKNLCASLEKSGIPQSFIFISSVSVYGVESGTNISEDHPLNGSSPYAQSKIYAEDFLTNWCSKHNVKLTILRPALIAGKNPPGNLGSMINAMKKGLYFRIGKGDARKSIVMANDVSNILPKAVNTGGIYNICDNEHPTFAEIENLIANQLGKKEPSSLPNWFAKRIALLGDYVNKLPINSTVYNKMTSSLTFSNAKAKSELDWTPLNVLQNFKIS